MRQYSLVASILSTVLMCGCGGGGNTSIMTVDGITITAIQPAGDHKFVGESSSVYLREKDVVTGLEIVVKKKQLSVNDRRYGDLQTGDKVRIEAGKVFVNEKEREPE